MAKRRMFSTEIVYTDHFMDMPASAQLLYFHLGMHADDDGFMASPRTMARCIGAREADLQLLADQGYIVLFDSGICWIRDWTTNNRIRRDCYTPPVTRRRRTASPTARTRPKKPLAPRPRLPPQAAMPWTLRPTSRNRSSTPHIMIRTRHGM